MNMGESDTELQKPSRRGDKGANLLEYSMLICLIALIAIAAIRSFGISVSGQWSYVSDQVGTNIN